MFDIKNATIIKRTRNKKGQEGIIFKDPEIAPGGNFVRQDVILDDSEIWKPGQQGTLLIEEWYAERRGWF